MCARMRSVVWPYPRCSSLYRWQDGDLCCVFTGHRNCYVLCLNGGQWRLVYAWNTRLGTVAARADVALKIGLSDGSCIHGTEVLAQGWLLQTWVTWLNSSGAQSGYFCCSRLQLYISIRRLAVVLQIFVASCSHSRQILELLPRLWDMSWPLLHHFQTFRIIIQFDRVENIVS